MSDWCHGSTQQLATSLLWPSQSQVDFRRRSCSRPPEPIHLQNSGSNPGSSAGLACTGSTKTTDTFPRGCKSRQAKNRHHRSIRAAEFRTDLALKHRSTSPNIYLLLPWALNRQNNQVKGRASLSLSPPSYINTVKVVLQFAESRDVTSHLKGVYCGN